MKLVVIGNCQSKVLSDLLSMHPAIEESVAIPVQWQGTPKFDEAVSKLKEIQADPDSKILTFQFGDKFPLFNLETLRKTSQAQVQTITNIYFNGLHPDCTYVGNIGKRVRSPIGIYHSKIVIDSFQQGLSPEACAARFNGDEYAGRGYYDAFKDSANELLKRDQGLDITVGAELLGNVCERPSLLTFNHPTMATFEKFLGKIMPKIGLDPADFPPLEYFANPLAVGVWWPVYDEIGAHHGARFKTPMAFRKADSQGGQFLRLKDFIAQSYAIYARPGVTMKMRKKQEPNPQDAED